MYGTVNVIFNVCVCVFVLKGNEPRSRSYHLFVLFDLRAFSLSRFLDVFGRQPSDGGRVLMVAPVLTDLMQLSPQMPVQTLVVKMLMSNKMSAKPKVKKMITVILQTAEKTSTLQIVTE